MLKTLAQPALYPPPEKRPNARMPVPDIIKSLPANSNIAPRWEDLLVAVGQQRDRQAFVQLFEHFAPRIKSFLMKGRISAAQADDLAQETMLAVWRKAPGYDPKKAAASTWIFTIARNRRIDLLRKEFRPEAQTQEPDENQRTDDPGPELQTSHAEDTKALAAALNTLPPEQADLIRKAYYEDKTHGDIAAETKLPLGTVKSRLRLALNRLRQTVDEAHR